MSKTKTFFLYFLSLSYILAGANHFIMPDFYLKIMPSYLPWHLELIYISGIIEIILGLAVLYAPVRKMAAWGIILLLFAVYPANIYHAMHPEVLDGPAWTAYVRLPLQFVFLIYAYWFTRNSKPKPNATVQ